MHSKVFLGLGACALLAGCNAILGIEEQANAVDGGSGGGTGGTAGAGTPDTGTPDTGTPDTGTPDTGSPDTGTPDTGALDTGSPDTGTPDTGTPDTGTPDTGAPDTGTADTGTDADSGSKKVSVKFCIDSAYMADGKNKLAEVKTGEKAYIVGDLGPNYPSWYPQHAVLAMTEEGVGTGLLCISLNFLPGQNLSYKFVKTASSGEWDNGEKELKAFGGDAGQTCISDGPQPDGGTIPASGFGLYELANNRFYAVPSASVVLPTAKVDAWRDYAKSFGYYVCK